jgi:TIR domain.
MMPFLGAIGGRKTIALVSEKYMDSTPCRNEFSWAFDQAHERIIPVLMGVLQHPLDKSAGSQFSQNGTGLKK